MKNSIADLMKNYAAFVVAVITVALSGCNGGNPPADLSGESAIHGTITIPVDAEINDMIKSIRDVYAVDHPNAHVTFEAMTSRDAMRQLMGGLTKGIVVAREYLPDEDSAMKSNAKAYPRTLLAKDALVFYVNKTFPYDTMSSVHIVQWFKGELSEADIKSFYPKLNGRVPTFVVPSLSSVQSNVAALANHHLMQGRVSALPTLDSIRARVIANETALVGIGYLSQFAKDSSVKLLRLSYLDSAGTYEHPRVVHAANLIRGMYPFPVPIYFILKDTPSQHSLTSGVMQYMARDAKAQRKFFDAGIEPEYARIELILPE